MNLKRLSCLILIAALLFPAPASAGLPGTEGNPVVHLRYIEDVYIPSIGTKAAEAAVRHTDSMLSALRGLLGGDNLVNEDALVRRVMSRLTFQANGMERLPLQAGSVLHLGQGSSLVLISGGVSLDSGVLTDLTAGRDVPAGTALERQREYVCLGSETRFRVTEGSSVIFGGAYRIIPPYAVMYEDLWKALVTMEIINTRELERNTTRMEMFIIFVTILGVKDEASVYPGTHPFTDTRWGDEYVAYLYANNHTAGTGNNRFSPNDPGSVQQLCFIMLKALGYQDGTDVRFATAVDDAVRLGLFSQREIDILQSESFTRDAMMYMTYHSLFAEYKTGGRVIDHLIDIGQVRKPDADIAFASVTRGRF
jgi:hypothetical protein